MNYIHQLWKELLPSFNLNADTLGSRPQAQPPCTASSWWQVYQRDSSRQTLFFCRAVLANLTWLILLLKGLSRWSSFAVVVIFAVKGYNSPWGVVDFLSCLKGSKAKESIPNLKTKWKFPILVKNAIKIHPYQKMENNLYLFKCFSVCETHFGGICNWFFTRGNSQFCGLTNFASKPLISPSLLAEFRSKVCSSIRRAI